jgi:multimeric flavodoxin WrbA
MKIIAFNGSPRKKWNTATLLNKALEGAAAQGAKTERIHLYNLNYKGCKSCFECKKINGKSYGKCAVKDDLTPILGKIEEASAIILGSPIYLGAMTGGTRSFLERLTFPYLVYDKERTSLFKKKMPVGLIYTLGAPEERIKEMGYMQQFDFMEMIIKRIFGAAETLVVADTYQFDDYSKYVSTGMDVAAKTRRRQEVFPVDCQKAFEMGARLAR